MNLKRFIFKIHPDVNSGGKVRIQDFEPAYFLTVVSRLRALWNHRHILRSIQPGDSNGPWRYPNHGWEIKVTESKHDTMRSFKLSIGNSFLEFTLGPWWTPVASASSLNWRQTSSQHEGTPSGSPCPLLGTAEILTRDREADLCRYWGNYGTGILRSIWPIMSSEITGWFDRFLHRKWRESKTQLRLWPDLTLLGCYLVCLHFLCYILFSRKLSARRYCNFTYLISLFPSGNSLPPYSL